MPSIIQDEKQAQALKDIERSLAIVDNINSALSEGATYAVTTMPKDAKSVKIDITAKDAEKVAKILLAYKKRLAKDIASNASQYRISLSEAEKESLC